MIKVRQNGASCWFTAELRIISSIDLTVLVSKDECTSHRGDVTCIFGWFENILISKSDAVLLGKSYISAMLNSISSVIGAWGAGVWLGLWETAFSMERCLECDWVITATEPELWLIHPQEPQWHTCLVRHTVNAVLPRDTHGLHLLYICSSRNTTSFMRAIQLPLEKVKVKSFLILKAFNFKTFFFWTTAFHDVCVSWRKPLFYSISLPNALFIFLSYNVLGRCVQIVFSHFPSVLEQKWTVHFQLLWFRKPSTFHTWQLMYKSLQVKYQY